MAQKPLSHSDIQDTISRLKTAGGNVRAAACQWGRENDRPSATFESRAKATRLAGYWGRNENGSVWFLDTGGPVARTAAVPTASELPDDDEPVEAIIDMMVRRYEKRKAHHSAKRWRRFDVPTDGPYGLMVFGDPHIDDDGCDWPLLKRHCALAASTPALYAVNIGDTTNNWSGRLARLYAEQETGRTTARKLVKWLLNDSGVPWWLWILGNHDTWPGPTGADTLDRFKPHSVTMEDWGAKVTLVSPNGAEFRVHASHDFSGHSQWNPLHGPMKEARWGDQAHLYVAGHKHNWSLFAGEHEHKGSLFWLARAKGYKALDSYADRLGFGSQAHGASILAVVDPGAVGTPSHVSCFADPEEGVEFLDFKRRRA
jgi:hypothetical protein